MDVREALLLCHSWNYLYNAIVATFGIMKYAPFDSFYLDIIVTLCLAWICSVCVLVQKYPPLDERCVKKRNIFSCSCYRSTYWVVTIFAQSPCRLREEKGYYIVVDLMYDVHLKWWHLWNDVCKAMSCSKFTCIKKKSVWMNAHFREP